MQHRGLKTMSKIGRDTLSTEEVAEIKSRHQKEATKDLSQLMSLPRISLINFALTEKNAKNKVYYFILSEGLLERYTDYCREH